MSESPRTAARRLSAQWIAKGYTPRALHEYRNADGSAIYWRIRLEHPDGDAAPEDRKIIRPMRLNGSGYTFGEPDFPDGKPLYHLDRIAADPGAPVWIVEGEKAADALTALGAVATTSGGADSADRADWSPLRGRECRLWRDNDAAGIDYAVSVAAILSRLDCRLSAVDVDGLGLPPKGDAWDWLQTHGDATQAALDELPMRSLSPDPADATEADSDGPRVHLIRGDSIEPEAVRWIWNGWIAAGKLHILGGPPGTGKTTLALALAATISSGGPWPDSGEAVPGDVAIWSGEDGIADTLLPRLLASGADMSRVHVVGDVTDNAERRPFDPAKDAAALSLTLSRLPDVRLLIVDSIVSAVAGDSHKNSETRRSLQPLVDLGEKSGCAILGITHFGKGTAGRDPVERIIGSIAFVALARIAFAAVKTKADDGSQGPRLFVRVKSNLSPDDGGFHYDLDQVDLPGVGGIVAQRVLWRGPVEGEARALLAAAEATNEVGGDDFDRKDAARWLCDVLKEAGGEMVSRDVLKLAREAGFPERTVERARTKARISIRLTGFGAAKRSVWRLATSPMRATYPPNTPSTESGAHGAYGGADGTEEVARDQEIPGDAGRKDAAPSASAWRVTRADGTSFPVRTVPPATLAEMREQYPGATVEPVLEAGA